MREVMRGYRLKIKLMEVAAGNQVEKIMASPTLSEQNLNVMNQAIIKMVMGKTMEALKEGVRFGKYIASKT